MRHRRRLHTQTIRRKSNTTSQIRFNTPKKKKSKKPLFFVLGIIAIAAVIYQFNEQISAFWSQLDFGGETTDLISKPLKPTEKKPAIPTDNSNTKPAQYYSPIEKKIQLEILNGCGESGVAKKLSSLLKKEKYDIVNSGNYMEKGKVNWDVSETRIIDQIGKQDNARELADIMGVLYSNVETYENPSPIADLTIIIGKDYKTLSIFQ